MSLRQITFNGEVQTSRDTTLETTWLTQGNTTWNTTRLTSIVTTGAGVSRNTTVYTVVANGCGRWIYYYACTVGTKQWHHDSCGTGSNNYTYSGGCTASMSSEIRDITRVYYNTGGTQGRYTTWLTQSHTTWVTSWGTMVATSRLTDKTTSMATTWTTEWITS